MIDPAEHGWPLDLPRYRRALAAARVTSFYHRPVYRGFEVFRRPGPLLVASNHGQFALEMPSLALGIWDAARRPVRGLGDRVLYLTKLQRQLFSGVGGVLGSPENAQMLLSRGEICWVCPGGAREALAPASERYKLMWKTHKGFVRCAIRASSPIVPLAVIGSEEFYRQVAGVEAVADTRFGRLVVDVLGKKYVPPVYVGLGLAPFPVQLRFHAGSPIDVPREPALADDEAVVDEIHEKATRAVEALIAQGLDERARDEAAQSSEVARLTTRLLHTLTG